MQGGGALRAGSAKTRASSSSEEETQRSEQSFPMAVL